MILLIDNYDSFTYNLYQYVEELGYRCRVVRNNRIMVSQIKKLKPDAILISPGPGDPDTAGICLELISELCGQIPIMGICLGHQAIGQAFGGKVVRAKRLMHGKTSEVIHLRRGIFTDVPSPFQAARYHSLIVEKKSLPSCLKLTAWSSDGIIMGITHKKYRVEGVQFHPESMMTEHGKKILSNFLRGK